MHLGDGLTGGRVDGLDAFAAAALAPAAGGGPDAGVVLGQAQTECRIFNVIWPWRCSSGHELFGGFAGAHHARREFRGLCLGISLAEAVGKNVGKVEAAPASPDLCRLPGSSVPNPPPRRYAGAGGHLDRGPEVAGDLLRIDRIRIALFHEFAMLQAGHGDIHQDHILHGTRYGALQDGLKFIPVCIHAQVVHEDAHDFTMAGVTHGLVSEVAQLAGIGLSQASPGRLRC